MNDHSEGLTQLKFGQILAKGYAFAVILFSLWGISLRTFGLGFSGADMFSASAALMLCSCALIPTSIVASALKTGIAHAWLAVFAATTLALALYVVAGFQSTDFNLPYIINATGSAVLLVSHVVSAATTPWGSHPAALRAEQVEAQNRAA
ncbi:MAG: hypothetical protein KDB82_10015 [Planctomycetes bacterium]|nr:hypothetical protein [Planctomycetota bacterium]